MSCGRAAKCKLSKWKKSKKTKNEEEYVEQKALVCHLSSFFQPSGKLRRQRLEGSPPKKDKNVMIYWSTFVFVMMRKKNIQNVQNDHNLLFKRCFFVTTLFYRWVERLSALICIQFACGLKKNRKQKVILWKNHVKSKKKHEKQKQLTN